MRPGQDRSLSGQQTDREEDLGQGPDEHRLVVQAIGTLATRDERHQEAVGECA